MTEDTKIDEEPETQPYLYCVECLGRGRYFISRWWTDKGKVSMYWERREFKCDCIKEIEDEVLS